MGVREKGNDLHIKLAIAMGIMNIICSQYNGSYKGDIKITIFLVNRYFLVLTKPLLKI